MELFDEKEAINPFFFFFFYEFGSKRTLLGMLVVFWTWVVTPIFKHISFKPFQICGSIFVHYGRPINI